MCQSPSDYETTRRAAHVTGAIVGQGPLSYAAGLEAGGSGAPPYRRPRHERCCGICTMIVDAVRTLQQPGFSFSGYLWDERDDGTGHCACNIASALAILRSTDVPCTWLADADPLYGALHWIVNLQHAALLADFHALSKLHADN